MQKSYSITEARNDLSGLIHDVERRGLLEITRRGRPVAVLLSVEEFDRIAPAKPSFSEAYRAWKRGTARSGTAVEPEHFSALRDRSPRT